LSLSGEYTMVVLIANFGPISGEKFFPLPPVLGIVCGGRRKLSASELRSAAWPRGIREPLLHSAARSSNPNTPLSRTLRRSCSREVSPLALSFRRWITTSTSYPGLASVFMYFERAADGVPSHGPCAAGVDSGKAPLPAFLGSCVNGLIEIRVVVEIHDETSSSDSTPSPGLVPARPHARAYRSCCRYCPPECPSKPAHFSGWKSLIGCSTLSSKTLNADIGDVGDQFPALVDNGHVQRDFLDSV